MDPVLRTGKLTEQLEAAECELQNLKFEKEKLATDLHFTEEEKGRLLLMVRDLETEVETLCRGRKAYACRDFEVQAAKIRLYIVCGW